MGDPTGSNPQRYSQALIYDLINEGYNLYMSYMIDSGEGDFAEPSELVDIVSGTYVYDLTSVLTYNPVKIRLVEILYGSEWLVLNKWEKNSGSFYDTGYSSGSFFPSYRFTGVNLVFNQKPNFSLTDGIRIEGYKQSVELAAAGDSPNENFHPIYHTLLVLYATIGCIESKEATGMVGDPQMFRGRLEKLETQFIETINNRSSSRESVDPFVIVGEESGWT